MNSGFGFNRLLMYGYDSTLLETRRSILRMAGFNMCAVAGPHNVTDLLASESYDLLIICHTVPEDERISIEFLAAQRHTPIFQVEKLTAPQKLVSDILRLVEHRVTA